jgi:hypothetical protein
MAKARQASSTTSKVSKKTSSIRTKKAARAADAAGVVVDGQGDRSGLMDSSATRGEPTQSGAFQRQITPQRSVQALTQRYWVGQDTPQPVENRPPHPQALYAAHQQPHREAPISRSAYQGEAPTQSEVNGMQYQYVMQGQGYYASNQQSSIVQNRQPVQSQYPQPDHRYVDPRAVQYATPNPSHPSISHPSFTPVQASQTQYPMSHHTQLPMPTTQQTSHPPIHTSHIPIQSTPHTTSRSTPQTTQSTAHPSRQPQQSYPSHPSYQAQHPPRQQQGMSKPTREPITQETEETDKLALTDYAFLPPSSTRRALAPAQPGSTYQPLPPPNNPFQQLPTGRASHQEGRGR